MDTFQQPKITGYRQLNETEATLMNEAKALGSQFEDLFRRLRDYHQAQVATAIGHDVEERNQVECDRIDRAEPSRWLAMGRTDIQVGVMKIVRSIAQPAS